MSLNFLLNSITTSSDKLDSAQPTDQNSLQQKTVAHHEQPEDRTDITKSNPTPLRNLPIPNQSDTSTHSSRCTVRHSDESPSHTKANRKTPLPIEQPALSTEKHSSTLIELYNKQPISNVVPTPTSIAAVADQNVITTDNKFEVNSQPTVPYHESRKFPFKQEAPSPAKPVEDKPYIESVSLEKQNDIHSVIVAENDFHTRNENATISPSCQIVDRGSRKRVRSPDVEADVASRPSAAKSRPLKRLNLGDTLNHEKRRNSPPAPPLQQPNFSSALGLLAHVSRVVQSSPTGNIPSRDALANEWPVPSGEAYTPTGGLCTPSTKTCATPNRRSSGRPAKPKRFSCHCGRPFSKREHLKRHDQLVHRLERPYTCTVCNAHFGTKQNMQVHLTTRKHQFKLASISGTHSSGGKAKLRTSDTPTTPTAQDARGDKHENGQETKTAAN